MRTGIGYDVHKLVENRDLILGGVKIEHNTGLLGHSDADVLIHAIMDSILGALALGDIGKYFPDTSNDFKDIDSRILLRKVLELVDDRGYKINNIDSIIILQKPKVAPYIDKMRENIAEDLKTDINNIGVKATTEEYLGFTGDELGIKALSICTLKEVEND